MNERPREFLLYMDESGSRDPDRDRVSSKNEPDWFGLGGVLLDAAHKASIESAIDAFRARWPQLRDSPLRSYDIRNKSGGFRWLTNDAVRQVFLADLEHLIIEQPWLVTGCVVHRPGYNARYLKPYGPRRWKLCRTSFSITVERAAKFAMHHQARLRVFIERSDPATEDQIKAYFDEMRIAGLPFDGTTSAKYQPLSQTQLEATLLEFGIRSKQSRLMQFADLTLWPLCKGGYDPAYGPYRVLKDRHKLLDSQCTGENSLLGVKYSCFPI